TTLDEGSTILKKHGFSGATEGLISSDRIVVDIQPDPGGAITVGNLGIQGLTYGSLSVPLGEIFAYLGYPCGYVIGSSVTTELTLVYPYADVSVSAARDWISPRTTITEFYIHSGMFWNSCEDTTPWPGFTSVPRYWYLHSKRWS